jgi:hypothetical protein
VIVTAVEALTALVVTVKVAVVAPEATVTLAGVVEDALLSDSVTVLWELVPTAGLVKVTVPVEELPPVTPVGLIVTETSCTALMLSPAVCVDPL